MTTVKETGDGKSVMCSAVLTYQQPGGAVTRNLNVKMVVEEGAVKSVQKLSDWSRL